MMPTNELHAARHAGGWIVLGGLFLLACVYLQQPGRSTGNLMPGSTIKLGVDINRASAQELSCIPGVGERLAERIVDYRQSHGPFQSLAELRQVPGIGAAKAEQLAEALLPLDKHPTHIAASPLPAKADR